MNISIEHSRDKACISLPDCFDTSVTRHFRSVCTNALNLAQVREIVMDFSEVRYIDSAALGSLLLLRQQAEMADCHIVLRKCKPAITRILAMANFHRIFTIE